MYFYKLDCNTIHVREVSVLLCSVAHCLPIWSCSWLHVQILYVCIYDKAHVSVMSSVDSEGLLGRD